ncbi:hypothetical protein GGR27_002479 [Lewinella antarctica]|uniref:Uncharacterized protein n=1 Tax=Neolewinella antarctica TaxID=442734 RepID=A0ABX0XDK1_9BACT|nr:hypothetical protein [Neolewinella antarctica]
MSGNSSENAGKKNSPAPQMPASRVTPDPSRKNVDGKTIPEQWDDHRSNLVPEILFSTPAQKKNLPSCPDATQQPMTCPKLRAYGYVPGPLDVGLHK